MSFPSQLVPQVSDGRRTQGTWRPRAPGGGLGRPLHLWNWDLPICTHGMRGAQRTGDYRTLARLPEHIPYHLSTARHSASSSGKARDPDAPARPRCGAPDQAQGAYPDLQLMAPAACAPPRSHRLRCLCRLGSRRWETGAQGAARTCLVQSLGCPGARPARPEPRSAVGLPGERQKVRVVTSGKGGFIVERNQGAKLATGTR